MAKSGATTRPVLTRRYAPGHLPLMLDPLLSWAGPSPSLFLVLLLALALDALLGDPPALYRAVPHPVVLIGRLIGAGDRYLNDPNRSDSARFWRGMALTLGITGLAALVGGLLALLLQRFEGGWLLIAVLASTLLAFRGLYDHVRAVLAALERDLDLGRIAVSRIVGRDPDSLDAAGVRRAAVESLAENFSDGVVAPAFWFALLGLPGLCAYKAINTLDSMIGHRNPRYARFGRFAARLDDLVNWIPARLAGGLFVVAALAVPGADAQAAWTAMLRDAGKHRSPNAGWQEAAVAGALDLALAGPRRYGGDLVDDATMGRGRRDLTQDDLRNALQLYLAAGAILALVLVLFAWLA